MEDLFWFIFQGFSHVDWTHCFQTVVKENNTEGNTWFSEAVHLRKAWMLTSGGSAGSPQEGLEVHLRKIWRFTTERPTGSPQENLQAHLRKIWKFTSERPGGSPQPGGSPREGLEVQRERKDP